MGAGEGIVEVDLVGALGFGVYGMVAGEGLDFFGTPFPFVEDAFFTAYFLVLERCKKFEVSTMAETKIKAKAIGEAEITWLWAAQCQHLTWQPVLCSA